MNPGRVIAAGLLTGLVLNIGEAALHGVLFADATVAAMKSLGHEVAGSGSDTAQLVVITFVQGLVGMLIYAAVQPRWKAGFGTAIRVGLVLWVLSAVYSAIYLRAGFAGLMPVRVVWGPVAWELILYPLAISAGSRIHRER
jgi:hypothetical protein